LSQHLRKNCKILRKSNYINIVVDLVLDEVECSLEKLEKINKAIRNVEIQRLEYIKEIKEKIEEKCTMDTPNAF